MNKIYVFEDGKISVINQRLWPFLEVNRNYIYLESSFACEVINWSLQKAR